MGIKIEADIVNLINDPKSIKVLSTTGEDGSPHVVFKNSIVVTENGYIKFWELIESSQTNRNLVYGIWNDRSVALNVLLNDRSFQIKGKIHRAIIYGREFEPEYVAAKEKLNADLSTVWLIEPFEIKEETLKRRMSEEEKLHPLFTHLDRIERGE